MEVPTDDAQVDDEEATGAGAVRPSRRRIWVRRALVLLVVAALFGTGTKAFADGMRTTQQDTAEVGAASIALRAERARLTADLDALELQLQQTFDERTRRTAERAVKEDFLAAQYAKLLGVNKELADLVKTSSLHVLSMAATKTCLLGVQIATEQASVDDGFGVARTLKTVAEPCRTANRAGQQT